MLPTPTTDRLSRYTCRYFSICCGNPYVPEGACSDVLFHLLSREVLYLLRILHQSILLYAAGKGKTVNFVFAQGLLLSRYGISCMIVHMYGKYAHRYAHLYHSMYIPTCNLIRRYPSSIPLMGTHLYTWVGGSFHDASGVRLVRAGYMCRKKPHIACQASCHLPSRAPTQPASLPNHDSPSSLASLHRADNMKPASFRRYSITR